MGLWITSWCILPSWGTIWTKREKKVLRIRYLTVFVSVLALAYACKQSGKDDGKETILKAKQLFWLMIPFSL
jgi:ABC-type branched-subunit amino acid transport system substrate-binding protein